MLKLESFLIHFYVSISGADEELVDQKKYLEESCQPKCVKPLIEYQACVKRVEADNNGEKHCTGQYFDYISCVDKCTHVLIIALWRVGCAEVIRSTQ
ncbi:Ubiquinol-cytochrome C reductase hinge protein, partial [Prunus dulcis]